jgi:hypothetical protein
VTPVPLDLPLRPSEAAELANLIFDQAERKALTQELRNRIAARGSVLRFETITPWFGSLERDPVHPSSYYLAVDGAAREPLLLHMAAAAAPTSSIFYKPLLIGRMRRANGPEIVLNSVPFGPAEHERLAQFAARIDTAFLPSPPGSRMAITFESNEPERDLPAAFEAFRGIQKRTGKNLAALAVPPGIDARRFYSAMLWSAIRTGWREGYGAAVMVTSRDEAREIAMFSRFTAAANDLENAARLHEAVRQARASMKIVRSFDFELAFHAVVSPEELQQALERLKSEGHSPQSVALPGGAKDELAAVARRYQCVLNVHCANSVETISEIAGHLLGY